MKNNILNKTEREFLSLNPELAQQRQLKDLVWTPSSSKKKAKRDKESLLISFLWTLKELFHSLIFDQKTAPTTPPLRPLLSPPENLMIGSYQPARFFSKGSLGKEKGQPIPYLLTETNEISQARPVPGNSLFLKSLSKGKGTLQKNGQGLFYLDIDNRFVLSLIPYLKAFGLVRAPYFNLLQAPLGAHIPVISPREATLHYLDRLDEVGQEFNFEIEGLYSLEPALWPEVEQVWFLKVRSFELEALRQRQFLISKPGGHSFHIAVAIKPRQTKIGAPQSFPTMRINIAFLAA